MIIIKTRVMGLWANREIVGDLRGVFIETSTLATTEVGLVTTSERTGSTTSVGEVGLVITLSSAPGKKRALAKLMAPHSLI